MHNRLIEWQQLVFEKLKEQEDDYDSLGWSTDKWNEQVKIPDLPHAHDEIVYPDFHKLYIEGYFEQKIL